MALFRSGGVASFAVREFARTANAHRGPATSSATRPACYGWDAQFTRRDMYRHRWRHPPARRPGPWWEPGQARRVSTRRTRGTGRTSWSTGSAARREGLRGRGDRGRSRRLPDRRGEADWDRMRAESRRPTPRCRSTGQPGPGKHHVQDVQRAGGPMPCGPTPRPWRHAELARGVEINGHGNARSVAASGGSGPGRRGRRGGLCRQGPNRLIFDEKSHRLILVLGCPLQHSASGTRCPRQRRSP